MKSTKKNLMVTIPTYNRSDKLNEILSSIPSDIDVVVSDNGNYTEENIKEKYKNVKFYPVSAVLDMYSNWNNALKIVDSQYFLMPGDDDLYLKDIFDDVIRYIEEYPEVDIFTFGHNIIDEKDSIINQFVPEKLQEFEAPYGFEIFKYGVESRMPSIVFKTEFIKNLGGFDTEFQSTAADSELIQRALLLGRAMFIPQIIASYRVWTGGLTTQTQASDLWLKEVKHWTDKISVVAEKKYNEIGKKFNSEKYKDEILASNILSAANALLGQDRRACKNFMKKHGIPPHANFRTRLSLYKIFIKSYCEFS